MTRAMLASTAAFVALVLASASPGHAQPARPATLEILPPAVSFENVAYAPGTSDDLTRPAAGQATLVVTAGGFTVRREGVTFSNLVFDGQGRLQGVVFDLTSALVLDLGAGCTAEIPSGQVRWHATDGLAFSGPALVRFPFRNPDGSFVSAHARTLRAAVQGTTQRVSLDSLVLQGPAGTNGVRFPGVAIAAAPWNLRGTWTGSGALAWDVSFPAARATVGVPGLAVAADVLEAQATNLTITSAGEVSFDSAQLEANRVLLPVQAPGFELRIVSGRVGMTRSVPSFQSILADLTLPPAITNAAGNGPAVIQGMTLDLNGGLAFDVARPFEARLGAVRILCSALALDLSNLAAPGGAAPPQVGAPSWMGVWFKSGTLELPLGGTPLVVQLDRFFIDANGLSGETLVTSGLPRLDLEGFSVAVQRLELGFFRSQIVRGTLGGALQLPEIGDLDAKVEFSLRGLEAMTLAAARPLDLSADLGLTLRNVKGSLALEPRPATLRLSGLLCVADPALEARIANFRIDAAGRIYLPEEGVLTLTDPAIVDLGAIQVEVRRVGFTSPDGIDLDGVSFTGTARLPGTIDGLALGGEIDLEHLTLRRAPPGQPPLVELGGLGMGVTIPQLGTVGASLKMSRDLPGFPGTPVLHGDAQLALEPLSNVGLGVTFLVAPERQAWFIGGDAMLPEPVRVDIPATPAPSPMVPLFQIKGFLGGFGMNVAPLASGPGIGPIREPEIELKHAPNAVIGQAGLMIAEYAVGDRVWWADATLTATFNPTMFDLTGRMALLDIGGVSGFPSNAEWRERDRIARVFVNLDLGPRPALSMGGDLDMNFPTRAFSLVDASGEALTRFAAVSEERTEAYMRIGCWWCDPPQRPLRIRVAAALSDYMKLHGKVGMNVDFAQLTGQMKFDTGFELRPVDVSGTLKGSLDVTGLRSGEPVVSGDLDMRGRADFEVVEANVRGDLRVRCTPRKVTLNGRLAGSVGCFEGEIPISETFE